MNLKTIYLISILVTFYSCIDKNTSLDESQNKDSNNEIVLSEFQTIIDSANVVGSVLIFDFQDNTYYSNNFKWANTGQLPASTFKIPNSIIAIQTGIVKNDSSIMYWNGENHRNKNWQQNLIFKDALKYSCVPCYQEIANNIGVERMRKYLDSFNYGAIQIDSSNLEMFWLEGESRINQFQQIEFLSQFYNSNLSISMRTEEIVKRMLVIEENGQFKISGKTGWSYSNEKDNGWFVGYIEIVENVYFFATNIEPTQGFDINLFAKTRTDITYQAFKQLKIIEY